MSELSLFETEPVVTLTDRQQYALERIGALQPLPTDELGALMHERRGKHPHGDRCTWCTDEGRAVGGELRRKGLVKMKSGEGWVVKSNGQSQGESSGYDPATAPFPDGF